MGPETDDQAQERLTREATQAARHARNRARRAAEEGEWARQWRPHRRQDDPDEPPAAGDIMSKPERK